MTEDLTTLGVLPCNLMRMREMKSGTSSDIIWKKRGILGKIIEGFVGHHIRLRSFSVVKEVAFGQKDKFHKQFQFVWMEELETVSSIAMSFLASPALMALRTSDHLYFMPAGGLREGNITVSELSEFLTRVAAGQETAYGGTSFFMRVRRLLFDIVSTILSIWQASRWLFLLMFGLPTLIISIICYSLCCMETIDDGPYDSEEEDEEEEGEGSQSRLYDGPPPPPALSRSGAPPPYEAVSSNVESSKGDQEKKNE
ncbi:protein disulfide-isomerase tmx3 [Plakobranchus ocellatus]|uniref:Protein disulfide-isomerase tmx3 n=1 Tax=Plakobranchus ocellatus TaxID=259542 RepID=A0AAV4C1E8_9GAST|nr:protein disulfide-isomerase tmx3 [Plakobranchus ocellatus]